MKRIFFHKDQADDWIGLIEFEPPHGFRFMTHESAIDLTEQDLYRLGRVIRDIATERGVTF